jgi:uncharacterized damage-inducible protein DinB
MRHLALLLLPLLCTSVRAQKIEVPKGYSPQIGVVVSMLEDLKSRVTRSVTNLSVEETDFLLDDKANRIGAMIYHLAATEKYYLRYTFEGTGYLPEDAHWEFAQDLGAPARKKLVRKPIRFYLDLWDEVRAETLRQLKTKDDKWFNSKAGGSRNMNNHWAWYHVMEHQANHMGQIQLIKGRLPR